VQGEKVFEKVIIPKNAGAFTIGPIEYSYFDPQEKRYIKKRISPIKIEATELKKETIIESPILIPGLTKEEVKLLKKDIRHIKGSIPDLKPRDYFLYKNRIFLLLNILPLVLLAFLYIYELHRKRLMTDIGYARSRRARGVASKRLRKARAVMSKGDVKGFYAEIYKATIEYIADKLNIPHPSITKDILGERLKEKGILGEVIEKLKELFDICDMARFAPSEVHTKGAAVASGDLLQTGYTSGRFTKEDMQKTIEEAADIIAGLERLR